jgi:Holliday junction resolvasome RuvABC endonuclease subunit
MSAVERQSLILGFHPTSHGFGWVAFSSPLTIYDFGLCEMRREKNAGCLRKLERLLKRLEPQTIVFETFDQPLSRRSERIKRLYQAAALMARDRGIEVAVHTRGDTKACFATVGAQSRQEIAEAIARSFEILRGRLPKPRRPWDGPCRRMALFDATAVVLTHYQLEASRLFGDLLDAAS